VTFTLLASAFALIAHSLAAATASAAPATQPAEPQPTQHEVEVAPGKTVAYLVTEPRRPTVANDRWMLVFLHGAGGSLTGYNLSRPPYAKIRAALAEKGAYVVVPALGGVHFMNDEAKDALTKVIDRVVADYAIDPKRVHLMGTSMGAGSALAYAVNRPDRVRSVCAIMPMTDFAAWGRERPKYGERLRVAYGGTPEERPQAYDANSAVKNAGALAKIPVLLIHGTADKTVPVSHSENLAAILKAKDYPCTFVRVDGGAHADDIVTDLQDQITRFLMDANR
jgi:dipeptidyl aminopeptidase/acylaminoacyl peptidase